MIPEDFPARDPDPVNAFITHWSNATGSERANYQLFLTGLCQLLEAPQPHPARDDPRDNAYVFERRVDIRHPDGSVTRGYTKRGRELRF